MMKSQTIEQLLIFSKSKLCNTATKQQYNEYNGNGKMVQWFNAARKYTGTKDTKVLQK